MGPFLPDYIDGSRSGKQRDLVAEALVRANAYLAAGADCVYPIAMWELDAVRAFISEIAAPVNLTRVPEGPPTGELAALRVARVSGAIFLHLDAMARFADQLGALRD